MGLTNSKYCPYCQSLILSTGFCRNRKCLLGNKNQATVDQLELMYKLAHELKIDLSGRDPNKLTKEKASSIIKKLLAKKAIQELYGSED